MEGSIQDINNISPIHGVQSIDNITSLPRSLLYDAFYTDERLDWFYREAGKPFRNRFNQVTFKDRNGFNKYVGGTLSLQFFNPLNIESQVNDKCSAKLMLPQSWEILKTKNHEAVVALYLEQKRYRIFIPPKVLASYQQTADKTTVELKLSLFFGVDPEINLFGLRSFFVNEPDKILITIPGIEREWETPIDPANPKGSTAKVNQAWGIGIDRCIITDLLEASGLADASYTVRIISCYSTGYRGFNLTILNKLIELKHIEKAIIYDAFYNHDDFPLDKKLPLSEKKTLWAIETLIHASPVVKIIIYALTHPGGTPRKDGKGTPIGPLEKIPVANKILYDLEFTNNKLPPIGGHIDKICQARLIQGGLDEYFLSKDISIQIMNLINVLPKRGSFKMSETEGTDYIYHWITENNAILNSFDLEKAFAIIRKHRLFGDWCKPDVSAYEFRHRIFVQEFGKEHLV